MSNSNLLHTSYQHYHVIYPIDRRPSPVAHLLCPSTLILIQFLITHALDLFMYMDAQSAYNTYPSMSV